MKRTTLPKEIEILETACCTDSYEGFTGLDIEYLSDTEKHVRFV